MLQIEFRRSVTGGKSKTDAEPGVMIWLKKETLEF